MTMVDANGARLQERLRELPALKDIRTIDRLFKGVIKPNGVHYKNQNKRGQTLVDISLYGGYPDIDRVPVASSKLNHDNGVEWTPDPGDIVLVQFINGNFSEPVVMATVPLADNAVLAETDDAPSGQRRYHLRCNKTDILIDKDGARRVYVAKDDILEVAGDGDIVVSGNVTVHIMGTADINVDGNTTVTTPLCTLNGELKVNGNITASGNVYDANGAKSMAGMRSQYDSHTHSDPQGGSVGSPNPQQ